MLHGNVRRFTEKATVAVFGTGYSFHCFRHTAAVRVWERTRDVLAVQRFLGHRSLQWTEAYLRSIRVVEIGGGPVAFCGGTSRGPRLFDPEAKGAARGSGDKRAGDTPGTGGTSRRLEGGEEKPATSMLEAFKAKVAEARDVPAGSVEATRAKMVAAMRAELEREEREREKKEREVVVREGQVKRGHRMLVEEDDWFEEYKRGVAEDDAAGRGRFQ